MLMARPGRPGWPTRGRRLAAPPNGATATPPGFDGVRFLGDEDPADLRRYLGDLPAPGGAETAFRILALSGGGAGGAFGAGALVGLTAAGRRHEFHLVTGVSTGALIAPFAFLGPAWDPVLTAGFSEGAPDLLALTALRPGPGLYAGEPLGALVRRYIDADMLAAVAEAHRAGRRLFIATSNLDTETPSIWDMGAIATVGGETAVQLFIDIVVASASLPGLFPPKMIAVDADGQRFEEMHVDGGAISPLFIVPEPLVLRRAQAWADRGVEVYALMNMTLSPSSQTTSVGTVPILVRSFELMLRSSYRSALRSVAAFCEINGFTLNAASVPEGPGHGSMLRFDRERMSAIFAQGRALAEAGTLWSPIGSGADARSPQGADGL